MWSDWEQLPTDDGFNGICINPAPYRALGEFAIKLGVPKNRMIKMNPAQGIMWDYFELVPNKRRLAIRFGAEQASFQKWLREIRKRK